MSLRRLDPANMSRRKGPWPQAFGAPKAQALRSGRRGSRGHAALTEQHLELDSSKAVCFEAV